MGFETNNYWASHRSTTLKVAARHVRSATQEETLSLDDITRAIATDDPPLDPHSARGNSYLNMTIEDGGH